MIYLVLVCYVYINSEARMCAHCSLAGHALALSELQRPIVGHNIAIAYSNWMRVVCLRYMLTFSQTCRKAAKLLIRISSSNLLWLLRIILTESVHCGQWTYYKRIAYICVYNNRNE